MKNILSKIYFHPFFLISVFLFISLGKFKFISYFMLIIMVHELGHILTSIYYKWNINKIIILPFGGLIKFDEIINRPLKEEFLISIMGVIFQMLFYLLINNIVDYKYFKFINYVILIFNLLPIYPLDGSKILNIINNKFFSYYKSLNLMIIISFVSIIILISFFYSQKLLIVIFLFLLKEVIILNKNKNIIFKKFLLERYLRNIKYSKKMVIKSIYEMKKDYIHLFLVNNKLVEEKQILNKLAFTHKVFDNNSIL